MTFASGLSGARVRVTAASQGIGVGAAQAFVAEGANVVVNFRAGFTADVIAVQEDPLKRIQVLGEPERILKVWKEGTWALDRAAPT